MSVRTITGVEHDRNGRILTLFGEDEPWSPVSSGEAARAIRAGLARYVAEGSEGTAELHAYRGRWVRTDKDATSTDNLDSLVTGDAARLGAGDFGLVVTVSPAGVAAIAREMHASGAVVDAFSVVQGTWLLTGVLGVPRFEPIDGETFSVVREVLCFVRPSDDAAATGFNAVATVTTSSTVTFTVKPAAASLEGRIAYATPEHGAVRIETPLAEDQAQLVSAALTTWLGRIRTDVWSMPLSGPLAGAVRVRARLAPSGHAQLGAGFAGTRVATFPEPRSRWDWTVSLSRTYVVARVAAGLEAILGGLPAPMGTDERLLVPGTADVYLRSLELLLAPGEIVISGSAVRHDPVEVTAAFTARFRLGLDAAEALTVDVIGTDVELVEWYARVADFLSGGSLTRGLEDGVRDALSGVASSAVAGLLDEDVLTRVVAAGTAASAQVRAAPRQVWVEPGSVQLGGVLERVPRAPQPRPVRIGNRVDATLSRAPGADLREVCWVVDGVEDIQTFERRALSIVVPEGTRRVALRLVTEEGQTATQSV